VMLLQTPRECHLIARHEYGRLGVGSRDFDDIHAVHRGAIDGFAGNARQARRIERWPVEPTVASHPVWRRQSATVFADVSPSDLVVETTAREGVRGALQARVSASDCHLGLDGWDPGESYYFNGTLEKEGDHDRSRPRGRSAAHARRARARGVAF